MVRIVTPTKMRKINFVINLLSAWQFERATFEHNGLNKVLKRGIKSGTKRHLAYALDI